MNLYRNQINFLKLSIKSSNIHIFVQIFKNKIYKNPEKKLGKDENAGKFTDRTKWQEETHRTNHLKEAKIPHEGK